MAKVKEAARGSVARVEDPKWLLLRSMGERLPDGVLDGIVITIIVEIFRNIESTVEDLIDYFALRMEELIDHTIEAGGEAIDEIIDRLEEDLIGALQWAKEAGYEGIPVMFDYETR